MRILAVECSTFLGSVAIGQSLDILSYVCWKRQRSHGQLILDSLMQALRLANLNLEQIDFLAVGNGPGSFTGIRVALSVIKTLAYSLNLPIVVFNSLKILAENYQDEGMVYVLQNAYSQKVFFAQYLKTPQTCKQIQPPQIFPVDQLKSVFTKPGVVLGCVELLSEYIGPLPHLKQYAKESLMHLPQADRLAILSAQGLSTGTLNTCQYNELLPLYLKDPVVAKNNRKEHAGSKDDCKVKDTVIKS